MNQVNEMTTKIWYDAQEVMQLLSISLSTYKRRLKDFKSNELYERLARKEFFENKKGNDPKKFRWVIHKEAVARHFGILRHFKNKKPSITAMMNIDWNLMGNFRIKTNDPNEYHHRIDFLIIRLIEGDKKSSVNVAYSLEKDSEGIHCHFLLKHSDYTRNKNLIDNICKLICQPTKFNLYKKDYDENYGDSGILYSLKNADFKAINFKNN